MLCAAAVWLGGVPVWGTPANRAALARHYEQFLSKSLNQCTTCHLPSDKKSPETLAEFPHNPFGDRLRRLGEEQSSGNPASLPTRLAAIAREDSDGDGVDNETELLLGHNPGNAKDRPAEAELAGAKARQTEFAAFQSRYPWQPYNPVVRPPVPTVRQRRWVQNPVDAFVAAEHQARGLHPRTEAPREVLMRRLYLDLIGLSPTPQEQQAFLADRSAGAYENLVDRLLDDARYGERWARHWMDVWRYSDWAGWTDGGQVRDSKPHIWRWRDWIVESLNQDKGYDRMVMEMLAADELAPDDTNALRATGFLVRNYKMLSREQWLEDTIKHTAQAFLGTTIGCAKCHDHMTEPISQKEYYQIRAIFEPHQVRTDRLPGQTNTVLDGLVRAFDNGTPSTWLLERGDERHPKTNRVIEPGVPRALGGGFHVEPVALPRLAASPDKHDWVVRDTLLAAEKALADARAELARAQTNSKSTAGKLREHELSVTVAEARQASLLAVLEAEHLEDLGKKKSEAWDAAARRATMAQRQCALAEASLKQHQAQLAHAQAEEKAKALPDKKAVDKATQELAAAKKTLETAEKGLAAAREEVNAAPSTRYRPRPMESYPERSTGRRLAFARWLTDDGNPLTARVAVNHIWLRHFGRGLVSTPADFGSNGQPPSHPQLLDWLAAEFMAQGWSIKAVHRLIVTSSTFRQASTTEADNARLDPENIFLWRMNSRRLEAEVVRDNVLAAGGSLDLTRGGPDIDHKLGLTSKRRSLYLRSAAEKEVEFLKIFDGPSVTECYQRRPSVVPQQALALVNSELVLQQARLLAAALTQANAKDDRQFVDAAFRRVLARPAGPEEIRLGREFLAHDPQHARERFALVLLNHNDFVTVR
jgi:hypothetical protein